MQTLPLTFHYDFLTSLVLRDPDFLSKKVPLMRAAGVQTVWLDNFIYGVWQNSLEDARHAKMLLEAEGFEVQAITVPLGHGGGDALNGDGSDPTIPKTWRNRVSSDGSLLSTTTCVDDTVIADCRRAAELHLELGFTKLFYDDDLRMASWGPGLQGCFCHRCLARFYEKFPQYDGMSRADIVRLASPGDALWEAWAGIQCDSVIRFLREVTPEGQTPGIMLMHNGDRRHGLDIRRMKEAFPHALFRVGEGHFGDNAFNHPLARPAMETSIRKQLRLIGSSENAFSETTTYPVGALSPEHLIDKIRLEIRAGLRNIYLMSGNVLLTEPYWRALIDARDELCELAAATPLPVLDGEESPEDFVWHL